MKVAAALLLLFSLGHAKNIEQDESHRSMRMRLRTREKLNKVFSKHSDKMGRSVKSLLQKVEQEKLMSPIEYKKKALKLRKGEKLNKIISKQTDKMDRSVKSLLQKVEREKLLSKAYKLSKSILEDGKTKAKQKKLTSPMDKYKMKSRQQLQLLSSDDENKEKAPTALKLRTLRKRMTIPLHEPQDGDHSKLRRLTRKTSGDKVANPLQKYKDRLKMDRKGRVKSPMLKYKLDKSRSSEGKRIAGEGLDLPMLKYKLDQARSARKDHESEQKAASPELPSRKHQMRDTKRNDSKESKLSRSRNFSRKTKQGLLHPAWKRDVLKKAGKP